MAERLFNRCVGPLALAVHCADHEVGDRLEALFAGFVEADVDPTVIAVVVRERRGDTDGWHLRIDERGAGFFAEAHLLEEALTRRVNRLVLDAEPDRLHLHAGAVARDGHAVLVVGPSGSGKSTLVAGLVAAGWQLLSDEQLGVLTDGRLVAFPRPITLRRASWPLFADVVVDPPDDLARIEVPIAHVGEWYRAEPIAPTIIVRPDVSVAESSRRDLSAAEALGVLVSDTLDLERAGDDGLDALLSLVTSGPMIRVTGTDLRASIDQIDQALAEAEPRRPATEASAVTAPPDCRTPGARAWCFDDGSAAIHDVVGGALAVVDTGGFDAWQMLGQPADLWPAGLADSRFLADLTRAGFLRSVDDGQRT